jgi:hypothetical protein
VPMRLALDRSSAAQQTYQGESAVVTHACRKLTFDCRLAQSPRASSALLHLSDMPPHAGMGTHTSALF